MFYPELRGYLTKACSEEEVQLFDRGNEVLENFEVDDFLNEFDTALGEVSDQGDTATVDTLKAVLLAMTTYLVNLHGIELDDTVDQAMVLTICESLYKLPQWSDRETLKRVVALNASAEERLAEIFQIVSGQNAETFMPHLTVLDPELLTKIAADSVQEVAPEFHEDVMGYIEDYKKFRNKTKTRNLWADKCLLSVALLGLPFDLHFQHFLQEKNVFVSDVVESNTTEGYNSLAEELIGLACISDVHLSGALVAIKAKYDALFKDMNQIQALDQAVSKLYMEVNRA